MSGNFTLEVGRYKMRLANLIDKNCKNISVNDQSKSSTMYLRFRDKKS